MNNRLHVYPISNVVRYGLLIIFLLVFYAGYALNISHTLDAKLNIMLNKAAYSDKKLVYQDFYDYLEEYSRVKNYDAAAHLATDGNLSTCWESFEGGESLTVDLQTVSTVDSMFIHWGKHPAMFVDIYAIDECGKEQLLIDNYCVKETVTKLKLDVKTRYIRILPVNTHISDGTCSISEVEATGFCPFVPSAPVIAFPEVQGHMYLTGGNWRIQRAANVQEDGYRISAVNYNTKGWLPATVPGTVLTSYIDAGAVPDNYFSDNQKQLSEKFFQSEFWYRNEFYVSSQYGSFPRLVFTGINYRVKVFVNGHYLGSSNNVFKRSEFDLDEVLVRNGMNALAVLVQPVDNPGLRSIQTLRSCGKNSGIHSADSPAFISSLGWDWIPSVPDRNIGLWNHVYIASGGPVTIEDPYVLSDLNLPDTTHVKLGVKLTLNNRSEALQPVVLKCSFRGEQFRMNIGEIGPKKRMDVLLKSSDFKELAFDNPRLWWPNGYGNQYLYDMTLSCEIGGRESDIKNVKFGIREIAIEVEDGVQKTYVNGHRIFIRGGNIGGLDINRRLDAKRIDAMIRLHKEMNFTAVRNWVGQTAHKEFYDACDRYGILIFDDFWLSSEKLNSVPLNFHKFMSNVRDKILQVRNHPSVMLYCGRNESEPPSYLNDSIAACIRELDSCRFYAPSSTGTGLSGYGPYRAQMPQWYFENRGMVQPQLHTEIGAICIPVYESICKMMPKDKIWPINDIWGIHDFTYSGAQNASSYMKQMEKCFGMPDSLRAFVDIAQLINYNTYRAMIECYVANQESNGLMLWMSQSAWPSLVWQTFDYYLEPSAAYFACKKASKPVHILWDSFRNRVAVSNRSIKGLNGLKSYIDVYDHKGRKVSSLYTEISLEPGEVAYINMPVKMDEIRGLHYLKLRLEHEGTLLTDNFYWYESEDNYRQMIGIPEVNLDNVKIKKLKGTGKYLVTIKNTTPWVLPMVRVKAVDRVTKENILPIYYSDNYFALLPGETKEVEFEYEVSGIRNDAPLVGIEGWKIKSNFTVF